MPQITLEDALRYFFSPFLLYFYFSVYDEQRSAALLKEFGAVGAIAFLVAGTVIYFVHRYLVFDYVISYLHDVVRRQTYRRYFQGSYSISSSNGWYPWHTARAHRLFLQVTYLEERLQTRALRLRASGIHLLYQAGLLAIPFFLLTLWHRDVWLAGFFAGLAVIFFFAAVLQDMLQEDEELAIIRTVPGSVEKAAWFLRISAR